MSFYPLFLLSDLIIELIYASYLCEQPETTREKEQFKKLHRQNFQVPLIACNSSSENDTWHISGGCYCCGIFQHSHLTLFLSLILYWENSDVSTTSIPTDTRCVTISLRKVYFYLAELVYISHEIALILIALLKLPVKIKVIETRRKFVRSAHSGLN